MSIHVFISRRDGPLDEGGPAIAADEWLDAISREGDFRRPLPEETDVSALAGVWLGHRRGSVCFDWRDGEVEVANPDPATVIRMQALATALRASVFSETGEVFDARGESAGFLEGYP